MRGAKITTKAGVKRNLERMIVELAELLTLARKKPDAWKKYVLSTINEIINDLQRMALGFTESEIVALLDKAIRKLGSLIRDEVVEEIIVKVMGVLFDARDDLRRIIVLREKRGINAKK